MPDAKTSDPHVPGDMSPLRLAMHKASMSVATLFGSRRVVRRLFPPPSLCFYDARRHPSVRGAVALSIDDAFTSGTAHGVGMTSEVLALLRQHGAHATFFTMLDGCGEMNEEAFAGLTAAGHELGNHMIADRAYDQDSEPEFEDALLRAQEALTRHQGEAPRWFRAPHGKLSPTMARVIARHGLTNVMMDSFADDPFVPDARFLARTMLRQATHGSILLIHMPERGFREWNFEALRLLLEGLGRRGLTPVTVSELAERAAITSQG